MAEDFGDKTEAPTPRRREEAREQGRVARSNDLVAASLLLGFMLLMNSFGPGLIKALRQVTETLLSPASFREISHDSIMPTVTQAVTIVAVGSAPLLLGGLLVAVVVNLAQVGFNITPKRLQPNLGALNPIGNLGKIFKGGRGVVGLLMNLLKLVLVTWLAWSATQARLEKIVATEAMDSLSAFGLASSIIFDVGVRVAALLLILALIDYAWQRYQNENELRMTKQEVKEEMRRMEGDPKIKQRRRQIAVQMMGKRLQKDVPTADVVITNPTHFAVALKYDSDTMHAPKVVAKGQDLMAQKIREIAIENGIPIIERKPLARALYKMVQVGQEIPEQYYSAVAEILAYVYELNGKLRQGVGVN